MKITKIILFVLILIFSMGFISAENIDDSSFDEQINVLSNVVDFSSLEKEIYDNGNDDFELDLEGKKVSYNFTNDVYLKNGIVINKTVTIKNGIIDANNNPVRIFNVTNTGTLLLENITLQNTKLLYTYYGGVIHNTGNVTIKDSTLNNNAADYGAVIYNNGTKFTIINSTFTSNHAINAGIIYNIANDLIIINSTFNNNRAHVGGAIYTAGQNVIISNSLFINNKATEYGGAIYTNNRYSDLNIINSIFYNNLANTNGDTVYAHYGSLNLSGNFWSSNNPDFTQIISKEGNIILNNYITINLIIDNENYTSYVGELLNYHVHIGLNDNSALNINLLHELLVNINNEQFIAQDNIEKNSRNITTYNYGNYSIKLYYFDKLIDNVNYNVKAHNDITTIILKNSTSTLLEESKIIANVGGLINDEGIVLNLYINNKYYGNNKTDKDGNFIFYIPPLTYDPGNYLIQLRFNGTNSYNEKNSNNANLEIFEKNVKLISDNITMIYRNGTRYEAILTDYLNNPIEGEIIFITVNGVTYNRTTDKNGSVTLAINLAPNTYNITTFYLGSDKLDNISITTSLFINPTIIVSNLEKFYLNGSQYEAKLIDKNGKILSNKNITFNINGVFYTRTTNEYGIATLNINLAPNTYIITAEYDDLKVSSIILVKPTLIANNLTKIFGTPDTYDIKVLDSKGQLLKGVNVTININGVFYTRTTNEYGIATLNINLAPNTYIITAEYDDLKVSSIILVKPTLIANNLTKIFGTPDTYDIKVLDSKGQLLKGVNVTININGVFYNRTTNSEGIAKLNINLAPNSYIATATYNGHSTSNVITVKGI
ncbi:hypothetical protein [Methanobrevibacter sp. DSM 116169]|uniref:hypothetical protein n=1 Tax=Methanobrevibacter sp. DSM 116169 TaxID=3242727 RepID=UPI0038FC11B8